MKRIETIKSTARQMRNCGRTLFREVGLKSRPWYVLYIQGDAHPVLYIYSGEDLLMGIIDDDGELFVYGSFPRTARPDATRRFFDVKSYTSVLQAVRLTFLMTQETCLQTKMRKVQERMLRSSIGR